MHAFSMPWVMLLGQENELVVGRSKQFGHNEDMKGSDMENEHPPPFNPYGIH